ncbi:MULTISPECIES: hypothetical protein [unclassified Microcoleus]|uniref:hypothetical protein n=1 Tax=unclassified Microcoleus TaxID=2642155 RepID=UPI002FD3F507
MAVTNIYGERELRAVNMLIGGVNAFYVFKTNVDASEVSDLGQVPAATLVGGTQPVFVGTGRNGRPRPARLKKKREKITSLCSTSSIEIALATRRWQMVKRAVYQGKVIQKSTAFGTAIAGGNAAKGSVLAVVTTSNLSWAWRMPAQQFNKIGADEATALGITIPNTDTEFRRLLVRANLPRPARAYRTISTVDNVLSVETFISDNATLPTDWTGVGEALKYEG